MRLRVPAGPEAGEREDERGDAERLERDDVDDEPAEEAQDGPGNRPPEDGESHHDDEEEVGRPSADQERRDDHDLKHRGDEDDGHRPQERTRSSSAAPRRNQDEHGIERAVVDVRVDLHLLEEVGVRLPDARNLSDRESPSGTAS